MNFVAGLLLLVSAFNEFEAFSFFCFVMVHQHVKEFFRERFPLLRKYIRGEFLVRFIYHCLFSHYREGVGKAPVASRLTVHSLLPTGPMLDNTGEGPMRPCQWNGSQLFGRMCIALLRAAAFDDMAKVYLPELHQHFMDEGVMAPVYLHQWLVYHPNFIISAFCEH